MGFVEQLEAAPAGLWPWAVFAASFIEDPEGRRAATEALLVRHAQDAVSGAAATILAAAGVSPADTAALLPRPGTRELDEPARVSRPATAPTLDSLAKLQRATSQFMQAQRLARR